MAVSIKNKPHQHFYNKNIDIMCNSRKHIKRCNLASIVRESEASEACERE